MIWPSLSPHYIDVIIDHDDVSYHQPHGCLLNRLFRPRSKKTSKLRVTGLCVGNSPRPVNPRTKGQLRGKCFYLMTSSWCTVIMLHMLFSFGITNWDDWFTCFRQIKIETVKEHRQYKNTYTVILLQPGKTENGHVKSVIFVRASGGALFSVKKGQGQGLSKQALIQLSVLYIKLYHLVRYDKNKYRDCKCWRPFRPASYLRRSPHLVAVTWKYKKLVKFTMLWRPVYANITIRLFIVV